MLYIGRDTRKAVRKNSTCSVFEQQEQWAEPQLAPGQAKLTGNSG